MAHILVLLGSPHSEGNNAILADNFIKGAFSAGATVHKFHLAKMSIRPCLSCGGCDTTGLCVVKDDMQLIYPHLIETDGLVIAAPIFFSGLAAQAKLAIDRCQPFWAKRYLLKEASSSRHRLGSLISTCGYPKGLGQFTGALQVMDTFYRMLDLQPFDNLLVPNIDKEPIADSPTRKADAQQLGAKMVAALRAFHTSL